MGRPRQEDDPAIASDGPAQTLEQAQKEARILQARIRAIRQRQLAEGGQLDQMKVPDEVRPLRDMSKLQSRRTLVGHQAKVYSIDWLPESDHLVSVGQDARLIVWNAKAETQKLSLGLKSSWTISCAASPSGNLVAVGQLNGSASIYNLRTNIVNSAVSRELMHHQSYISAVRFFGNDNRLMSASNDATSLLWDIEKVKVIQLYQGHEGCVMCLEPLPSRNLFVTGGVDKTLKVWDIRADDAQLTFSGFHQSDVNSATWFPDQSCFIGGSDDGTCRLFDLRAYGQLQVYQDMDNPSGVTGVACSNGGRVLFAACDDLSFRAYDVMTGQRLVTTAAHGNRLTCLRLSPDGQAFATGSWDSLIRIWA